MQTMKPRCAFNNLEVRHYHLLPEKNWEVDLDRVKALADENTMAIVVINPGNLVVMFFHLSIRRSYDNCHSL